VSNPRFSASLSPNRFAAAAFFGQGFECVDNQFERTVQVRSLVLARRAFGCGRCTRRGRGATAYFGRLLADQIIVINEFIAVIDEKIRGGVLDADADDGLGVFAQFADQRREIRIAAEDDEGVDMPLGVAQIECIDDHANVRRVLA